MGIYGFLYDLEERISVCGKEKIKSNDSELGDSKFNPQIQFLVLEFPFFVSTLILDFRPLNELHE